MREKYDLSVVCINNNDDVLNCFLLPSIHNQENAHYEVRILDNRDNHYRGAREAFNEEICCLQGEYVLFVHNDFYFEKSNEFQKIISYCKRLEPFGVLGVVGCGLEARSPIRTRIKQGRNKQSIGEMIDEPVSAMSVDECCFVIKKSQLLKTPFANGEGWHLYAVEYCLQMLDYGLENYILPIDGWHYSDGISLNDAYCREIKVLLEKYCDKFEYINTTVRRWSTGCFTREIYLRYYTYKQRIKAWANTRKR